MNLYKTGSLLLDISLAILLACVIVRIILTTLYFRRNGSKELTDRQRRTLRNTVYIILSVAILFGISSLIVQIIYLI